MQILHFTSELVDLHRQTLVDVETPTHHGSTEKHNSCGIKEKTKINNNNSNNINININNNNKIMKL